jgi:ATP-dependent Clp protease ATP-binding subunit ClpA
MTNRITEELIRGIADESKTHTITVCKFIRYCLNDEFQENIEFLKSRGSNVKLLTKNLDEHIKIEDSHMPPNTIKELRQFLGLPDDQHEDTTMMTADLKSIFDICKSVCQKEKREMFFEDILNSLYKIYRRDPDIYAVFLLKESGYKHNPSSGIAAAGKYKHVNEYCENLNEKAKKKKIDPLIGRKPEVERIVEILAHYKKKNPLLIGKPGVGKTAVVEGLASLIEQNMMPEALKGSIVYSLNVGNILAGSKFRGEFEDKVKGILKDFKLMQEKEKIKPILFIDEIHQIIGAGAGGSKDGVDLSNMIKPGLANGELSCIGATTEDEYNSKIIKDKALMRRFQEVKIEEPSPKETLRILKQGIKPVLEKYHAVSYTNSVLERIVDLSGKYITTQYFPDKAISVADSVGARLNTTIKRRSRANIDDVEKIISQISGTPVSAFKQAKNKRGYVDLSSEIKKVIFGQDDAIDTIVEQVELSKAGFSDKGQPIGSFLLLGPTGTGKTELAKQIAEQTGINFFQINMSEYSEEHSVAKLFGAPPGYEGHDEGGILTNQIMKYPQTVLLLDEIEKANKKVYDALLGIIDGAKMTDGRDNVVDFSNVLVLMTSNAGAAAAASTKRPLGLNNSQDDESKSKFKVSDKIIKETFSPEFRNKLTGLVNFNTLSKDVMLKIADKFIKIAELKLLEKGITLEISEDARLSFAEEGYDPAFGARPMKKLVDSKIIKQLVKPLLKGDLKHGDTVKVYVEDSEIKLNLTNDLCQK